MFSVEDPGTGMSVDQLSKTFAPFVQADTSTTREFGGTGLGLSICRDLTEVMGGAIDAFSELRVGTEMKVEIPLQNTTGFDEAAGTEPSEALFADVPEDPQSARIVQGPIRSLLAEDGRDNQLLITRILTKAGFEIIG